MPDSRASVEHAWWPTVLITPASPETFEHEDFSGLVQELAQRTGIMADEIQRRLGYLYGDAFPPDWTWINVVLDEAGRRTPDAVVAAVGVYHQGHHR